MLGPLWARAYFSSSNPEILNDPEAKKIIESVDYDFSMIEKYLGEWRALGLLIRARKFDDAIKKYIERYPLATIVNIGAGLDTTFSRIDNGKIMWYNLDLPDAIEFRKRFIPETSRNKCIAKSAFDTSWFNDIEFKPEKGIFFVAGGFFYYFNEEENILFFKALAKRFYDGELIFDTLSKFGIKVARKKAKKFKKKEGIEGANWVFGISKAEKFFSKWSNKIQVVESTVIYSETPHNPKWEKKTIKMMKITSFLKVSRFIQIKFLK